MSVAVIENKFKFSGFEVEVDSSLVELDLKESSKMEFVRFPVYINRNRVCKENNFITLLPRESEGLPSRFVTFLSVESDNLSEGFEFPDYVYVLFENKMEFLDVNYTDYIIESPLEKRDMLMTYLSEYCFIEL